MKIRDEIMANDDFADLTPRQLLVARLGVVVALREVLREARKHGLEYTLINMFEGTLPADLAEKLSATVDDDVTPS